MEKVKRVLAEIGWLIKALLGVVGELLLDSLTMFLDILKLIIFFVVCLPLIMVYRWITRKIV